MTLARTSDSRKTSRSSPSTLISVPPYLLYRTSSPSLTSSGRRSPSSTGPSPTAITLPFWGFSLAVSGRTRPLAVVSSSSIAWTISRSPRGLSFIRQYLRLQVYESSSNRALALHMGECQARPSLAAWLNLSNPGSKSTGLRSVRGQQPAPEEPGDALGAVSHHPVVVPGKNGASDRGQQVHPGPGGVDVPLVDDRGNRPIAGAPVLLEQPPAANPGQLARRVAFEQVRLLHPCGRHLELEVVGELRAPGVASDLAETGLVAFDEALRRDYATPPIRPALGLPDRVPDRLAGRLQAPGGEKAVLGHRRLASPKYGRAPYLRTGPLVGGGRLAVAELRPHRLDHLREANHGHGVLVGDVLPVD